MGKAKTKVYKSEVKASIHEIANGLRRLGMIDKQTMRRFDDSSLTPALVKKNSLAAIA